MNPENFYEGSSASQASSFHYQLSGFEDSEQRSLAEVMANLTVVEIPGANHGSSPTAPLFTESLLAFLAEHRGAS